MLEKRGWPCYKAVEVTLDQNTGLMLDTVQLKGLWGKAPSNDTVAPTTHSSHQSQPDLYFLSAPSFDGRYRLS